MTHITSIGAGIYSDLSVSAPSTDLSATQLAALSNAADFQALFATSIESQGGTKGTNTFVRIKDVREFPSIGTPANIVNVPVYGSKTSQQIQGQADSPTMEITLNFVGAEWSKDLTNILGNLVGNGKQYVFRFTLMNSAPTGSGVTKYASTSAGLGTVGNSQWYFIGKIEALLVNPQLTDATTATLTIAVQSEFFGAYTV